MGAMTPMPEPATQPRDQPAVLAGAEPFHAPGTPDGPGALVLHGFTGSPQSVRPLGELFAAAGFAVELPRLPGHGTSLEDLISTRWPDWSGAAEDAYALVAGRSRRVVAVGLSVGGALAAWLATRHPELAGIAVVNPAIDPPAESFREMLRGALASGTRVLPGIGSDIADPERRELAYDGLPIEPLLSLCDAGDDLVPELGEIRCPVLIMTSPQDHVVPPVSSDILAGAVSGPVERVTLERSYHVATLDYDKELVERQTLTFGRRVTAS